MTRIYLDVDNVVRVDSSATGKQAMDAAVDCAAIKFLNVCQRSVISIISRRAARGEDTPRTQANLEEVLSLKAETLAHAHQRIASL